MALQVYEFDAAQYLQDNAAIEAYLENAKRTGTPEEIEEANAVAARARAQIEMRARKAAR